VLQGRPPLLLSELANLLNDAIWQLFTLFALSFSAATLLPGGSEAALIAAVNLTEYPTLILLTVASIGNTFGSVLNYALGRYAVGYAGRKWFPISPKHLTQAQDWFSKWGQWSVLLAWVPIIGDPITCAAGALRMHFLRFLILVFLSKTLRYMVVLGLLKILV
jgi:membrane protein YqaA with SNARE-associated domain